MRAIFDGDISAVKTAITGGAPLNKRQVLWQEDSKETPLTVAAQNERGQAPEIIKLLLAAGANVNYRDEQWAESRSIHGDRLIIRYSLVASWSPLMYAAKNISDEAPEVVRLLLEAGAKTNDSLQVALNNLSDQGPRIIRQLINAGVNVNAKDHGKTPLLLVAECKSEHAPEIVAMLLKAGAKVNVEDDEGWTPLMIATRLESSQATEVAKILREAGAK
jgi:ankyrin repeat protein